MIIETVKEETMPGSLEHRYYFSGYITPELIQDLLAGGGGYGPTHKEFAEDTCKQILKKTQEMRVNKLTALAEFEKYCYIAEFLQEEHPEVFEDFDVWYAQQILSGLNAEED